MPICHGRDYGLLTSETEVEDEEEEEEEEEERGEEASCSSLRMHLRLFFLLPTYAYERYMIMIKNLDIIWKPQATVTT